MYNITGSKYNNYNKEGGKENMFKKCIIVFVILSILCSTYVVVNANPVCQICGLEFNYWYCDEDESDNGNCTVYNCYSTSGGFRYWCWTKYYCVSYHSNVYGEHVEWDILHASFCPILNGYKCPY